MIRKNLQRNEKKLKKFTRQREIKKSPKFG